MNQRNHFWDMRYQQDAFIYGELPNNFFASCINELAHPGKILFPCEGEGRNAVYAATLGWDAHAFDGSWEGKNKALKLAEKHSVAINYQIEDAMNIQYNENSFDIIALIYAHFPSSIRTIFHHKLINWLKPGGRILIEGFSKNQLNFNSGGPKESDLLYSKELLEHDFQGLYIEKNELCEIELNEGELHKGIASVIRFVGYKQLID